ncbi:MAG: glycosyltransferase family 39 protein [Fimbriimonadales bacterium]|nr:glycosyltransferase family 39 protein [Fimbriimonadales bacterium]
MRRLAFGLVILAIGLLALFKPVHIDDTVVLHVAQNILKDPLRPFAGEFFWLEEPQPLARVTTNPPLVSYWLAPFIAVGGYREWWLHLAFVPFVWLLAWGMYRLTTRFLGQEWAWWGVGWVLLSPAVLPGMNLMRDVPAFALFVSGLACWVQGLADGNRRSLVAGALLGGLSGVAKYTALLWIPLALLYMLQRRAWRQLGWLALALLPITLWSAMNLWEDGMIHLLYLWQERRGSAPWTAKFLPAVVGLGASLLLVWGVLPHWRKALGAGWAWKTALIACGCVGLVSAHATLFAGRPIYGQTLFWLVSGGVLLGVALLANPAHLSSPSYAVGEGESDSPLPRGGREVEGEGAPAFLRLWLLLALLTAVWGVPFQAMRHLLYALPPLVLLLLPLAGKRPHLLLLQGSLSLLALAADFEYAQVYRTAARWFAETFEGKRVWYVGSWGWMFYAEQQGFRKLLPSGAGVQAGDIILVPQRVYKGKMPSSWAENALPAGASVEFYAFTPLRTMGFEGAAYYALIRTNAPFQFKLAPEDPLESIQAYTWSPSR